MIKKLLFFSFLFFLNAISSQEVDLSQYKYIIVPERFDFLKEDNQYQTSTITKFYKRIVTIFKDKYQLSLYYNAIIYKLKVKLNL